jgi:uncharacterized membrane protein YhiD involved in acid resistance
MLGQAAPIPIPSIALDPRSLTGSHPATTAFILLGTLVLTLVIASVYKATHRGLSYSQAFQFSLVLLGMLGASIMMVASTGILPAVGILGGFSLIRFRTPVKDPKDMAYILFVLAVGLAMGARLYYTAAIITGIVTAAILILTRLNFGLTYTHETIIRLMCVSQDGEPLDTDAFDSILRNTAESSHLLSAVGQGTRMELTYGVRPRRGNTNLQILHELRQQPAVEHAELFDAKHQVEF